MINTKQDYESPITKVLEIRFRNSILTGSNEAQSSGLPTFTEDSILDW